MEYAKRACLRHREKLATTWAGRAVTERRARHGRARHRRVGRRMWRPDASTLPLRAAKSLALALVAVHSDGASSSHCIARKATIVHFRLDGQAGDTAGKRV